MDTLSIYEKHKSYITFMDHFTVELQEQSEIRSKIFLKMTANCDLQAKQTAQVHEFEE